MSESQAPTPALRRSIVLLSFATFSSMCAQRVCDAMLPALASDFSVSLAQAAQVVSFFAVVYGAAQLLYGPLGDRLGKYRVIVFTTLACSIGSVLSALAPDLRTLVLGRVLVALAAAAMIPMSLAWVGDAVAYEQRQEMLARLGLGSTMGLVGGQLLGGFFTDWIGWRWAFVALTLLFAVVAGLLWKDWRQQQLRPHALAGGVSTGPKLGMVALLRTILRRPHARSVMGVAFCEGIVAFGAMAIWATHLHVRLGLSLSAAGATVAMFGLGGVLYMTLARRLIPRLGERGLVLVGGTLFALGACIVGYTPHWSAAPLACLAAGFGLFMLHNTLQTNATQMAPEARGMGVALFAASLFMGQSVGVLLAAGLSQPWGSAAVIALAGVCTLGVAVFFAQALRWRDAAAAVRS